MEIGSKKMKFRYTDNSNKSDSADNFISYLFSFKRNG